MNTQDEKEAAAEAEAEHERLLGVDFLIDLLREINTEGGGGEEAEAEEERLL